ncbi:hypothetical protein VNI00_012131 [Paramarasmius palmivorus]|uniref:F-box domain-containing protein n=1 Tax=Paramarasmius palmivorus TaxID=297713 RepID=A0AAW0C7Y7_9AGAR
MDGEHTALGWRSQMQEIDQKIAEDLDIIRERKSLRNSFAPVNSLPNEVLSQIFYHCTTGYTPVLTDPEDQWKRVGWISLTQVCRRWRSVALGTPSLYHTPDFEHPSLASEMLRRGKRTPLDITIYGRYFEDKSLDVVEQYLDHIDHTTNLVWLCQGNEKLSEVLSEVRCPAPILRTLNIEGLEGGEFILSDEFLGGKAPNLTHLDLEFCVISWTSPIFNQLRHLTCLSIDLDAETSIELPTAEELLAVLANLLSLRKLRLKRVIPSDSENFTGEPVHLPYLNTLSLSGTILDCVELLEHIAFPKDTSVEFDYCKSEAETPQELFGDLERFAQTLPRLLPDPMDTMNALEGLFMGIEALFLDDLEIKAWTSQKDVRKLHCCPIGNYMWYSNVIPRLSLGLSWDDEISVKLDEVVQALLPSFPLQSLQTLHVRYGCGGYTEDTFSRFFSRLPNLVEVDVWGGVFGDLVGLIGQTMTPPTSSPDAENISQRPAPLFPALQHIGIGEVDFESNDAFLTSLLDGAKTRNGYGSPIQSVIIAGCTLSKRQLTTLKAAMTEGYIPSLVVRQVKKN